MKKISSKYTAFFKKGFPPLWVGVFGFIFALLIFGMLRYGKMQIVDLIFSAFMSIFGYVLMKRLFRDVMDEVWDDGDKLVVKNNKREVHIYLANVKNISYFMISSPHRVTLSLRESCELGDEIPFLPRKIGYLGFKKNTEILELIDRVDRVTCG